MVIEAAGEDNLVVAGVLGDVTGLAATLAQARFIGDTVNDLAVRNASRRIDVIGFSLENTQRVASNGRESVLVA